MKQRGFEIISKFESENLALPKRATTNSAGYDIASAVDIVIKPKEIKLVSTGLKAYMNTDEVLFLFDRSSNPKKQGVVLANSVGVIDSDYYNNDGNEGEIFFQFSNITDHDVTITKGQLLGQGVFQKFLMTDNDDTNTSVTRTGGFGSTTE